MLKSKIESRAALMRVAIFWKLWRRWKRDQPKQIPTYASNGRRLSDSSHERVERLLRAGYITVKRHSRTGQITSCQFIFENFADKTNPIRKRAHMGQHYCVKRTIADHQVWQHRELAQFADPLQMLSEARPEERAAADLFIRKVFLEVPLSCMQPEPPNPPKKPAKAKVIPFAATRTEAISVAMLERKAA